MSLQSATLEELEQLNQDAISNVETRIQNLEIAKRLGIESLIIKAEYKLEIARNAYSRINSWTWKKAKGGF